MFKGIILSHSLCSSPFLKLILGPSLAFANGKQLAYQESLDGKANTSHTHSASNITSGTLSVSRGGTGRSTLTSGYFLRGNGTGAVTMSSISEVQSALGISSSSGDGGISFIRSVRYSVTNSSTYVALSLGAAISTFKALLFGLEITAGTGYVTILTTNSSPSTDDNIGHVYRHRGNYAIMSVSLFVINLNYDNQYLRISSDNTGYGNGAYMYNNGTMQISSPNTLRTLYARPSKDSESSTFTGYVYLFGIS